MTNGKNPKKGESLLDKILSKEGSDTPFNRPLVVSEREILDMIEKLLPDWCDEWFITQQHTISLQYDNSEIAGPGAESVVTIGGGGGQFRLGYLAKHLRDKIESLIKVFK